MNLVCGLDVKMGWTFATGLKDYHRLQNQLKNKIHKIINGKKSEKGLPSKTSYSRFINIKHQCFGVPKNDLKKRKRTKISDFLSSLLS